MPANLSGTLSTAIFDVPGLPLPVALRRYTSARRLRLRVDAHAGLIRLSMPVRMAQRTALLWAGEQAVWVARQLEGVPAATPLEQGSQIPFRGEMLLLEWNPDQRRVARRVGDRLVIGGPAESFSRLTERWLIAQALDALSELTTEIAAAAGLTVRSVGVGDPVSRWGSCSASGAIRYSWRLVLAPPQVLRFVVAHEVAHRLHMDHSPAFKAVEERLFGGPVSSARSLLRELGPALRGVGRRR